MVARKFIHDSDRCPLGHRGIIIGENRDYEVFICPVCTLVFLLGFSLIVWALFKNIARFW